MLSVRNAQCYISTRIVYFYRRQIGERKIIDNLNPILDAKLQLVIRFLDVRLFHCKICSKICFSGALFNEFFFFFVRLFLFEIPTSLSLFIIDMVDVASDRVSNTR